MTDTELSLRVLLDPEANEMAKMLAERLLTRSMTGIPKPKREAWVAAHKAEIARKLAYRREWVAQADDQLPTDPKEEVKVRVEGDL